MKTCFTYTSDYTNQPTFKPLTTKQTKTLMWYKPFFSHPYNNQKHVAGSSKCNWRTFYSKYQYVTYQFILLCLQQLAFDHYNLQSCTVSQWILMHETLPHRKFQVHIATVRGQYTNYIRFPLLEDSINTKIITSSLFLVEDPAGTRTHRHIIL